MSRPDWEGEERRQSGCGWWGRWGTEHRAGPSGQAASTHHPLLIFAAPVQAGCMSLHSVLGWFQPWPSLLKPSWVSLCYVPAHLFPFFWESIRSCLCFGKWFSEGRLDLEPGWCKVPFPRTRTGLENGDCSPKSWWRVWTVLLIPRTCGDLGDRTDLYCKGLSWAGSSITDWAIHPGFPNKRSAMEEKHTAHNQRVGLKYFQACFYHTETYDSYYKKLLLEFISFSLQNFKNHCFGSQQIYYGGFSPWSYFPVKNANTRQHKWKHWKMKVEKN